MGLWLVLLLGFRCCWVFVRWVFWGLLWVCCWVCCCGFVLFVLWVLLGSAEAKKRNKQALSTHSSTNIGCQHTQTLAGNPNSTHKKAARTNTTNSRAHTNSTSITHTQTAAARAQTTTPLPPPQKTTKTKHKQTLSSLVAAWPVSSNAMTTTAAPWSLTIAAWRRNASSPSLSEIELTMHLPCAHLRPASTIGNLDESIMNGTRLISGSGLVCWFGCWCLGCEGGEG